MKKIFTLFFLLITLNSFAKKYYVSTLGNDSYSTTQAQNILTPWKTLSKVNSMMYTFTYGDSILFKRGDKFTGVLRVNNQYNIVFGPYGTGTQPLFWGTGSSVDPLIWITNSNYITIKDIKISDTTISLTDRTVQAKILIAVQYDNSTDNVISKCTFDRVGVGVYYPNNLSSYNTIDSCDIGNMRMVKNTPTSVNSNDDYGANPTVISSSRNTITHNYFHDCWAISYDYGYDGGAIEFFGGGTGNNFIAYNTFIDCNGTVEHGSKTGGVMNNNMFAYNKIINCGKLFYINNSSTSGFQVSVKNLQFYNNVVVESYVNRLKQSDMGSMSVGSTDTGIVVFKNNVVQLSSGINFVRGGQFNGGQMVHTNNVFKITNGGSTNITLGSTESLTTATFWTSTTNSNPLYWDYTPLSGSILVNKGIYLSLTQDYLGKSIVGIPDIGVIENLNGFRVDNPTYVRSNIKLKNSGILTIMTPLGQIVKRIRIDDYTKMVNLDFLNPGMYIANIKDETFIFYR